MAVMWKVLAHDYKPTTVTYDLMTKKISGLLENLVDNVAAL